MHPIWTDETVPQLKTVIVLGLDISDGETPETGLDLDDLKTNSRVIKANGSAAAGVGDYVEFETGAYGYEFDETEIDEQGFVLLITTDALMKTYYSWALVVLTSPHKDDAAIARKMLTNTEELDDAGLKTVLDDDGIAVINTKLGVDNVGNTVKKTNVSLGIPTKWTKQ